MATINIPLMEKSTELRFEVAQVFTSHEKANDKVWQHIDLADRHVNTILDGGQVNAYHLTSLQDQLLRKEVQQVQKKLNKLRKIYDQYHSARAQVKVAIDQEFSRNLNALIKDLNKVESLLHNRIQADLATFKGVGIALIIAVIMLAFFITKMVLKNHQKNAIQIAEIEAAKQTIEASNQELQEKTHYDFLTKLPNRALFTDILKTAIAKAQVNQQSLVLFFIDLDQFKSVNDSFGHAGGDKLLQMVAERLNHMLNADGCAARLSGDEFALLLPAKNTLQEALDCATRFVKQIQLKLAENFFLEEIEIFISASIGIALYSKDGDSAESILKNADRSMHNVKQMGKNNYRFFSAELEHLTQRKFQLERDLRNAIQANELELYYQPQWDFKTGGLYGLEALVRWNHPQKGMIFPDEFIAAAETSGLIYQLDMWVLEAACKQINQWENLGLSSTQVSVNMSAVQFSTPNLVKNIASLLTQYKIRENKLEIEIVESILMQDSEQTLLTLNALKELGIRIAVDDFGTGYSSMAYLGKFPIDVLKIDRTFVMEIGSSSAAKVIVESIIQMGSKLGLMIVAEGIETVEQNHFLADQGCTFAQGYFYNKPMPVNDVEVLLRKAA